MMTDADRTVLLAMDFQNGIAGDEAFAATGVLERARDAVATAREHDIPVVWVRVALREGQPELAATASFARIAPTATSTKPTPRRASTRPSAVARANRS